MGKYQQDAAQLLKLIGGKENIAAVSHCVTRMRFVLNAPKKADTPGIEAMKAAKQNQNMAQRVMAAPAEIFAPLIPAILAAFALVYLEKFFRRIAPQAVSMIVVPFCSLLLSVIAAHFVLGPIGWKIGSAISSVVYAGISGSFKVIFGAVFGFVYAPLVITGLAIGDADRQRLECRILVQP